MYIPWANHAQIKMGLKQPKMFLPESLKSLFSLLASTFGESMYAGGLSPQQYKILCI